MLFTAPRSPFTGYLHAPPPDDDDDDAVWLLPLPLPLLLLLSPLFLIFCGQTRADVLYWMKHYYRHPQADLLKIAFESLRKERMTPEDGWLVAGLVAGIIKHSPDSVSNRIICEAYDTLGDFRQGLLVGLWLGGDHGKDYLQVLKEEEQDAQMKEVRCLSGRSEPMALISKKTSTPQSRQSITS